MQKLRPWEFKWRKQEAKPHSNPWLSNLKVIISRTCTILCLLYLFPSVQYQGDISKYNYRTLTRLWELRTGFNFTLIMKQSVESTKILTIALIFECSSKLWCPCLFRFGFVRCVCKGSREERRNGVSVRRELLTVFLGQEDLMQSLGFSPTVVQEATTWRKWGLFIQAVNQDLKKNGKQDPQLSLVRCSDC